MKSIQIKWNAGNSPFSTGPYYSPNPAFCWFGLKDGNGYAQVGGFHTCRETFMSEVQRKLGVMGHNKTNTAMTLKFLRVLVKFKSQKSEGKKGFATRKRETDRWMKDSVRMLNVIEKYLGWGLTRLMIVEDKSLSGKKLSDDCNIIYALIGSAKWMRAPQLMSLYLLFVRLGCFYKVSGVFKRMDDLDTFCKILEQQGVDGQAAKDRGYLVSIKYWLKTVLDNRQELFFSRPLREGYRLNNGWHGINNLIVSSDADSTLKSKWLAVKKAAQKKG